MQRLVQEISEMELDSRELDSSARSANLRRAQKRIAQVHRQVTVAVPLAITLRLRVRADRASTLCDRPPLLWIAGDLRGSGPVPVGWQPLEPVE